MHGLVKNIAGYRSGLLVAVSYIGNSMWLCQCDCGGTANVPGGTLTAKARVHCGCKRRIGKTWEPIEMPDGCVGVPLTKGKVSVIDAADLPLVRDYKWFASRQKNLWHTFTWVRDDKNVRRNTQMHRLILGAVKGQVIDHVDGDGLNNRRSNIRFCTTQQNAFNSKGYGGKSRFKGVYMNRHGTWSAAISIDKKLTYIGTYLTEEDAARAYDDKAAEIQGEFARFNLPRPQDA